MPVTTVKIGNQMQLIILLVLTKCSIDFKATFLFFFSFFKGLALILPFLEYASV